MFTPSVVDEVIADLVTAISNRLLKRLTSGALTEIVDMTQACDEMHQDVTDVRRMLMTTSVEIIRRTITELSQDGFTQRERDQFAAITLALMLEYELAHA